MTPPWASRWCAGLPYLRAEAVYAARYEMARSVDDILSRRTRARLLGRDASAAAAPAVAALVADDLGWDDAEQQRQVKAYRALVDEERAAIAEPAVAEPAATETGSGGPMPESALDATPGA